MHKLSVVLLSLTSLSSYAQAASVKDGKTMMLSKPSLLAAMSTSCAKT